MLRKIGAGAAAVVAALALVLLAGLGTATPASAGPETSTLRANEQLAAGQRLVTANGISLVMQADGKLVELAPGNRAVWWITTNRPGTVLRMQADGNLALVVPGNYTIWSTRTAPNPGAALELGQDGSAVVYSASRAPLWTNGVRISVPTAPTTTAPTTPAPTTAPTTAPTSAPPTTTGAPTSAPPTSTSTAPTPVPTTAAPATTPAAEVAALTNGQRTANGCPALQVDARLTTAAQGHATDMAVKNYFSHTSQDGRTFDVRIRNAGYPSPGGENIAKGQTSASAVVTAWMNSPGHRANILNCSFKTLGVGFDARGNYWVQNFGY